MSPRTWENERTVKSVLQQAGYYQDGSKAELQSQFIEEEDIQIGDKSYTLSRISKYDVNVFANELDGILSRMNPFIWDIFAKFSVNCLAAVRLANIQAKQGFRGASARGNELDALVFNARQFYDPDNSGTKRTSWVRTIAATGTKAFFEGATTGSALTLSEEECLIWLGFYNPALSPCSDAFQITINTDLFDIQGLDFDQVQVDKGDPIIEFKEPWILPPEEAGEIDVYYFQTGTDDLRPIGLWIKEAKNMRALATP